MMRSEALKQTWRLKNDCSGVAAVEFALCAPLFGLLIMGIITIGFSIMEHSRAREALRAGAQAIMSGEEDPVSIQSVVDYSLGQTREKASVSVQRSILCGTVSAESTRCGDGKPPAEYITIDIHIFNDPMKQDTPDIRERLKVRVR